MKLAEALLKRAELKETRDRLKQRVLDNAKVQDGDEPAEDPKNLLAVLDTTLQNLQTLIMQINRTNASTTFEGTETIADALARRDILSEKQKLYQSFYNQLSIQPDRYSQTEIRFVRCLDPADVQKTIDKVCQEYRELDTKLQGLNWLVDLKED
ncbi:MAG: DIP1984 family protein [Clostridia bacterium]|nr:DIP1984 family protein [Clostridia bacterium]